MTIPPDMTVQDALDYACQRGRKIARLTIAVIPILLLCSGCVTKQRPALDYGQEMLQRWESKPKATNIPPASIMIPPMPAAALKASSVVARNFGSLIAAWNMPSLAVQSFQIFNTNGTLLQIVSGIYSNATLRGLPEGVPISIYAVSVDGTDVSDRSNIASGVPRRSVWKSPATERYVDTFQWKCAPGVTNILQGSTNLSAWTNVVRFRGTNGTAVVTVTNPANFHRVMIQNATNVMPMTLTQSQSLVVLKWTGNGKTNFLQREIDATSGSFETVIKSTATGSVQTIQPAGKVWRLVVSQ